LNALSAASTVTLAIVFLVAASVTFATLVVGVLVVLLESD
jgi:hypothetical protein